MTSEVRDTLLRSGQFRLRTALLGVTIAAIIFAIARRVPAPWAVVTAGLFEVAIALAMWSYFTLGMSKSCDSPLSAAWAGTIIGGGAFAIVLGGLGMSSDASMLIWIIPGSLLISIYGMIWALIFSPFGLIAAVVVRETRKRHDDPVPGAVCGAVTGFASIGIFTLFGSDIPAAAALVPAAVGALYGGLASRQQIASARQRRDLLHLDEVVDLMGFSPPVDEKSPEPLEKSEPQLPLV